MAVGTDGSATATEAVKAATEIARRFDAEPILLGVLQDEDRPLADDPERQWTSSPGAGLRELLERVLGSVPNTVTHRAPCSVFVVKAT